MQILVVNPGNRVRTGGDYDAPDGEYTVGYVENEHLDSASWSRAKPVTSA